MKTIWTPWRLEHILGLAPKVDGCLFEPPGDCSWDEKYLLLYRDATVIVLMNRFPYTNGHLLVAPARHIGSLLELTSDENLAIMAMLQSCVAILNRHLSPDGLNIGCNHGRTAGAGIADHLHFHIVPRWENDHNFMTVIAEIRLIPEHILATFQRLLPDFRKLHSANAAR